MTTTFLQIITNREAYRPLDIAEQKHTLTVGELKEILEDYDEDLPVILNFDNGYTYGSVKLRNITEESYGKDY